ncbi:MAG: flagellar biosynthesis protein FlhF [Fibrobacter sp.]|nr:flagellar biosynthesis protein FlhF [Fibrobacter sp.]
MRIKKYIANSMREALLQIKDELGEDAIILKTRKLPKKVFGIAGQEEIEVTAAVDEDAVKTPKQSFQPITLSNPGLYNRHRTSAIVDTTKANAPSVRPWKPQEMQPIRQPRFNTVPVQDAAAKDQQIDELKQNVRELKDIVAEILKKEKATAAAPVANVNGFTGEWSILYRKLLESEVKQKVAYKLIKEISGTDILLADTQAEKKFVHALSDFFPVAGPLKLKKKAPLIVAFVGPTGAGKTTTLAKLAAHCCVNKQKRVSIITADTYRIAAIEQIKMFAEIVKINLQVVFSPDEIQSALTACAQDDIVFVDTAGRSQRNKEHMDELVAFVNALHPDETHLVMSATTKDSDLLDIINRYKCVNVNRLLFTKLDETVRTGNILNIVNECRIPVSYFTFGQSVPDDIELAQTTRFVQHLWEGVRV